MNPKIEVLPDADWPVMVISLPLEISTKNFYLYFFLKFFQETVLISPKRFN